MSCRMSCPEEGDALPLPHCLAKSRTVNGVSLPGRTVEDHCRIAGAVAAELLARMPELLRRFFSGWFSSCRCAS